MVLSGAKIFLVEDDFLIQLDLTMTLENAGATVVAASSVSDGLAKIADDFDAAVLDVCLPDGDVFPVASKLDAFKTPLIFHSGNIDTTDISKQFPDAISLAKPAHESVLIEAVQRRRNIHVTV